ncbi:MAG: selenocysteine-specific translation elongation factor [Chloroflexota bacterium]
MQVIGTAGHIDHGKSTLVHALTGIDPDRLREEKERGMTIELGFAWLTLPGGQQVSVVDVPGHERFIRHMLAGVGGIDVALLVVAADEGVMPQTREHVDILGLLQVAHGVVALTKIDHPTVDAEWMDLVTEDITAVLAPTALAGSPVVPCSALTGAGLPHLLEALQEALSAAPRHPDRGRPHLPIDRVFTLSGFGTVVTGTLLDGVLEVGQDIEVAPSGRRGRIRGLQTHRTKILRADPGGRVAVNITGISTDEIARGDVLCLPGAVRPSTLLDVRLRVLADAGRPLTHNMAISVHTGAAEAMGRLSLLDAQELEPGASGWVQLRLARPVAAFPGDRCIVRVPTPSATIGGGVIVDVAPTRHRRFAPRVLAHLDVLAVGDPRELVAQALYEQGPLGIAELARRVGMAGDTVTALLNALESEGRTVPLRTLWYATPRWNELSGRLTAALAAYHGHHPFRAGAPAEEMRARLGVAPRAWTEMIDRLTAQGTVAQAGDALLLSGHEIRFNAEQQGQASRVIEALRAQPYTPPSPSEVGAAPEVVEALLARGEIVKLADTVYLDPGAYRHMVEGVLRHIDETGSVNVAQMRDLFGTSRKYSLALLEHLDAAQITRRVGDVRVRGSRGYAA